MSPGPVGNVLVLGGGSAGFMAALALKARLPTLRVTVVRSKDLGIIGVGVLTGPGFGAGARRAGGNLRAGWQAPSGWQLVTSLGYAWRASTVDFTAAWLSLDVGVGYRLAASDAFSVGANMRTASSVWGHVESWWG